MRLSLRIGMLVLLTLLSVFGTAWAGDWVTLETNHFVIYSQTQHKAIAERLAAIAEEVYPTVTDWVGHVPEDRTHVVLSDTADTPNGVASPFFHNKIMVFPVFPGNSVAFPAGLSTHTEDPLRSLFIHEYTHIVQMDINDGVSSTVRALFGQVPLVSTPNLLQPPMSIEGLAVTAETNFTSSGRGRDPYYDMFLRAAVLDSKLLRLDQALSFYLNRWNPAGAPYLYGASFTQYLVQHFGMDKVREINDRFARGAIVYGDAVRKTLGITLEEAWGNWQAEVSERYKKQAEEIKTSGVTSLSRLNSVGDLAQHPALSPDGRYVAYATTGTAVSSIRLIDTKTGQDRQLVAKNALLTGNISWSPGGTRIVYSRFNDDSPNRIFSDIYYFDLKTNKETRLTHGLRAYSPTYSPDGKGILFIARPTPLESNLMVVAADGGIATDIKLKGPAGLVMLSVEYAPDRRRLVVAGWLPGGFTDLYLGDLQARTLDAVTQDAAVDENPAWSSDGRYVLYDSDLGGVYNIHAYDTETGKHYQVTNVLTGAFAPSPSAAVEQVVAMEYTAQGYKLAVFTFDPVQWRTVTRTKENLPVAMQTGAGASAKSPITATHVYSALPTLVPTYWLPVFEQNTSGTNVGILTSGEDILSRIMYSTYMGYNVGSKKPAYNLEAMYNFGSNEQWQLGMRAVGQVPALRNAVNPALQEQELSLGYKWGGQSRVHTLSLSYNPVLPLDANGNVGSPERNVGATWRVVDHGGNGNRKLYSAAQLTIQQELGTNKGSAVYVQGSRWSTRTSHLTLETAVGIAQTEGVLTTGGKTYAFGMRGIKQQAAGTRVAGGSAQFDWRMPIEKGYHDWPLFLSEFTVGPFADATFTDGPVMGSRNEASVGVEASLSAYVGYHFNLDLRMGIAKPVMGAAKAPSVYVGGRVPF